MAYTPTKNIVRSGYANVRYQPRHDPSRPGAVYDFSKLAEGITMAAAGVVRKKQEENLAKEKAYSEGIEDLKGLVEGTKGKWKAVQYDAVKATREELRKNQNKMSPEELRFYIEDKSLQLRTLKDKSIEWEKSTEKAIALAEQDPYIDIAAVQDYVNGIYQEEDIEKFIQAKTPFEYVTNGDAFHMRSFTRAGLENLEHETKLETASGDGIKTGDVRLIYPDIKVEEGSDELVITPKAVSSFKNHIKGHEIANRKFTARVNQTKINAKRENPDHPFLSESPDEQENTIVKEILNEHLLRSELNKIVDSKMYSASEAGGNLTEGDKKRAENRRIRQGIVAGIQNRDPSAVKVLESPTPYGMKNIKIKYHPDGEMATMTYDYVPGGGLDSDAAFLRGIGLSEALAESNPKDAIPGEVTFNIKDAKNITNYLNPFFDARKWGVEVTPNTKNPKNKGRHVESSGEPTTNPNVLSKEGQKNGAILDDPNNIRD